MSVSLVQNISSSSSMNVEKATLKVPPIQKKIRPPSTPERSREKKLHARDDRLEFKLHDFALLVKNSMDRGIFSTKELTDLCTTIYEILRTKHIYEFQSKRIELEPDSIDLLKDSFQELSFFLKTYQQSEISLERLEEEDLNIEGINDAINSFFKKRPRTLRETESSNKKRRVDSYEPLKIMLTTPSGEAKLLVESSSNK